ncbi:MAG: Gfo/Idh/MocA family oxidoreductase [Chromatiales bacterium]|nr:Gfo/Idh/MocA family oxidoreductase [Chromatiales bacterium]
MPHRVTVIGLGVMGQRMLANMSAHPQFEVAVAWDPDADARAFTVQRHPQTRIAASAEAAIADPDTGVVYVASPPAWHAAHAIAALDAGKAVYCEKPLAVDLAEGRALVERAERSPMAAIVNFSSPPPPRRARSSGRWPPARWATWRESTSASSSRSGRGTGRWGPSAGCPVVPRAGSPARWCRTGSTSPSACSGRPGCVRHRCDGPRVTARSCRWWPTSMPVASRCRSPAASAGSAPTGSSTPFAALADRGASTTGIGCEPRPARSGSTR